MMTDAVYRTRIRAHSDRKLLIFMLGCSLTLHGGVVAIATANWGFSVDRERFAPVYSVELVSLPAPSAKKRSGLRSGRKARPPAGQRAIPIQRFRAKEQPLSLRKKQRLDLPSDQQEEIKLAKKTPIRTDRRPSRPPPEQEKGAVTTPRPAVSQKKVSLENIGGMKGGELSQALVLYRALVNERIESNWIYPEQLGADRSELQAVVVVRARRDGAVTDIQFEKKSGNPYFDDSVLKAILKSKPFPPFPDIYSPKEEEIVIRFSPAAVSS
jgi:TonB family protein